MRLVVDAGVAVEYLLRTPLGQGAAPRLEGSSLMAPELLDAEVLHVLRREVLLGRLDPARAAQAVEDLRDWPVRRLRHAPLLARAWRHRDNLTAYDALYVAAAEEHAADVITADGPLARAPGVGVPVHNVRM